MNAKIAFIFESGDFSGKNAVMDWVMQKTSLTTVRLVFLCQVGPEGHDPPTFGL